MPKIVDANIIIRYLLGDSPLQTERIKKYILEGKEKLILTDVTIAEIVWVLSSYYKQPKENICEMLFSLLGEPIFIVNKRLITQAVSFYREYSVDYIDAYLAAIAMENDSSGVMSFDKSIDKIKEIKRSEP